MAKEYPIHFQQAEHCAFFFEDNQLLMVRFEREDHRLWFVVDELNEEQVLLGYPGELYVEQIKDKVENIFFVELTEADQEPRKLALGAYFPVGEEWYGAYYERGQEPHTLYFLHVTGVGPEAELEAVEETDEYQRVADEFSRRYRNVFNINTNGTS